MRRFRRLPYYITYIIVVLEGCELFSGIPAGERPRARDRHTCAPLYCQDTDSDAWTWPFLSLMPDQGPNHLLTLCENLLPALARTG